MTCTLLSVLITIATAQCAKLNEKLEGIVLGSNRAQVSVLCRNPNTGETFYFGELKTGGCILLAKRDIKL